MILTIMELVEDIMVLNNVTKLHKVVIKIGTYRHDTFKIVVFS